MILNIKKTSFLFFLAKPLLKKFCRRIRVNHDLVRHTLKSLKKERSIVVCIVKNVDFTVIYALKQKNS